MAGVTDITADDIARAFDVSKYRYLNKLNSYKQKFTEVFDNDSFNSVTPLEKFFRLAKTFEINLNEIRQKMMYSIMPSNKRYKEKLRNHPDLIGSTFCIILYALLCVYGQIEVVLWVTSIWIVGCFLIFMIVKLLDSKLTYYSILSVVGYSIIPLCLLIPIITITTAYFPSIVFVFKLVAVMWASTNASSCLVDADMNRKQILILYPIILLNVYFMSLFSGV